MHACIKLYLCLQSDSILWYIIFQLAVIAAFDIDADVRPLVDMIMSEYAGHSVADDPVTLKKAYIDFLSDQFILGFDEILAKLTGKHLCTL